MNLKKSLILFTLIVCAASPSLWSIEVLINNSIIVPEGPTASVPDAGPTLVMLGLGLAGLYVSGRKILRKQ